MRATKAILVLTVGVIEISIENLESAAEVRGFKVIGYYHNPKTREEMQGAPLLSGLFGPSYGGAGIVRYEDHEMNRRLSQ